MKTKQRDVLNIQNNAEKTHNEESTSVHKPIENTPFTMHCVDNKWFISMQKYRLIEPQETEEEALQELERCKWMIILSIAAITQETLNKISPLQGQAALRKNEHDDRPE